MKKITKNQFMNLADSARVAATAEKAVNKLYAEKMYTSSIILVSAYIDWMAEGSEKRYKKVLRDKFPKLCSEMSADTFYDKIRCGMVHRSAPRSNYALIEEHESEGKYVNEISLEGQIYIGLNIDRVIKDFLMVVRELKGNSSAEGN